MDRDLFLVISLTFCLLVFFSYLPNLQFLYPYEIAIAFIFLLITAIVFNLERMLVSLFILLTFSWLHSALPYVVVIEVHLAMFFLAVFLLREEEIYGFFTENSNSAGKIAKSALHGIGLFATVFLLVLGFSFVLFLLGFEPDTAQVYARIVELPLYILLFAFLFAPVSEEVLFRGFLAERYGIFISALAFSISHVFYNSKFELAGTFLIGLAFAYYFKKQRNIVACMIAHSLFNISSIALMFMAGRG